MWQDWAIAGIQLALIISFFPTIFSSTQKPTLSTSILTASCIYGFGIVYFTLGFWSSVVMSGILATQWAIVAYQRYHLNKRGIR